MEKILTQLSRTLFSNYENKLEFSRIGLEFISVFWLLLSQVCSLRHSYQLKVFAVTHYVVFVVSMLHPMLR